jgi:hypothetical protein
MYPRFNVSGDADRISNALAEQDRLQHATLGQIDSALLCLIIVQLSELAHFSLRVAEGTAIRKTVILAGAQLVLLQRARAGAVSTLSTTERPLS